MSFNRPDDAENRPTRKLTDPSQSSSTPTVKRLGERARRTSPPPAAPGGASAPPTSQRGPSSNAPQQDGTPGYMQGSEGLPQRVFRIVELPAPSSDIPIAVPTTAIPLATIAPNSAGPRWAVVIGIATLAMLLIIVGGVLVFTQR